MTKDKCFPCVCWLVCCVHFLLPSVRTLIFVCDCLFSYSNCKQSDGCVLLRCLFTASKPHNDIQQGPNRNPEDPVKYSCGSLFTPMYNKSMWERDVMGTLFSQYIILVEPWEQHNHRRCWCSWKSDMSTSDTPGLWWWHARYATHSEWLRVFMTGKIKGEPLLWLRQMSHRTLSSRCLRLASLKTHLEQLETLHWMLQGGTHGSDLNSVVMYSRQGSEHSGVGAKLNALEHIQAWEEDHQKWSQWDSGRCFQFGWLAEPWWGASRLKTLDGDLLWRVRINSWGKRRNVCCKFKGPKWHLSSFDLYFL